MWRAVPYDAVVLDLMLPDQHGLTTLESMRDAGSVTPVLILTALDAVEDRVRGLDTGADDYLVKPFALQELVARLRALLRRPGAALGRVLMLANVSVDSSARQARVGETPLELTRSELVVLESLLRNQGRVVPKGQAGRSAARPRCGLERELGGDADASPSQEAGRRRRGNFDSYIARPWLPCTVNHHRSHGCPRCGARWSCVCCWRCF